LTGTALLGYAVYTSIVRTFSTEFIAAWFPQPARAEQPFQEVSGQAGAKAWDWVSGIVKLDGFVKRPDAVYHLQVTLRFILRHCGVRHSTPHSSGFARLACGLFTKPSHFHDF
jgi:hypothetical protein